MKIIEHIYSNGASDYVQRVVEQYQHVIEKFYVLFIFDELATSKSLRVQTTVPHYILVLNSVAYHTVREAIYRKSFTDGAHDKIVLDRLFFVDL